MIALSLLCSTVVAETQRRNEFSFKQNGPIERFYTPQTQLAASQLGYRTDSPKSVSLIPSEQEMKKLPDEITFYICKIGSRQMRETKMPKAWQQGLFRWPFDISKGKYILNEEGKPIQDASLYTGTMRKVRTEWGTFWRGDFSDFTREGHYQIECEYGFTTPFVVEKNPYQRLERSYLLFLNAQRSGCEVPGVRPLQHADDGYLDSTRVSWPVAGGWNDAGDFRKWIFLTAPNYDALANIAMAGHPAFNPTAIDESKWGNLMFHQMITDQGRVYEDVSGGKLRSKNNDYSDWWWENHPGCTANGDEPHDNIPSNGVERPVRMHYNQSCQFIYAYNQAKMSRAYPDANRSNCQVLAERAWRYGEANNGDRRTLFVSVELMAACELYRCGSREVTAGRIIELATELMDRQAQFTTGLSGFFYEDAARTDGYRSIAYSCAPAMALLMAAELELPQQEAFNTKLNARLRDHLDNYLLKDAATNPWGVMPWGVFVDAPYADQQKFRDAGNGNSVRTFLQTMAPQHIPHGTGGAIMHQAYLMARASHLYKDKRYADACERHIQWMTGDNPYSICLFTGVGFRHPIPANFAIYRVPDGVSIGFIGRVDDTPYIETSNAVEWSTQEVWDIPFGYVIGATTFLTNGDAIK